MTTPTDLVPPVVAEVVLPLPLSQQNGEPPPAEPGWPVEPLPEDA